MSVITPSNLNRIQKWDKAKQIYGKIQAQRREAAALHQKLGQRIDIERALARRAIESADVSHYITGGWGKAGHRLR